MTNLCFFDLFGFQNGLCNLGHHLIIEPVPLDIDFFNVHGELGTVQPLRIVREYKLLEGRHFLHCVNNMVFVLSRACLQMFFFYFIDDKLLLFHNSTF